MVEELNSHGIDTIGGQFGTPEFDSSADYITPEKLDAYEID